MGNWLCHSTNSPGKFSTCSLLSLTLQCPLLLILLDVMFLNSLLLILWHIMVVICTDICLSGFAVYEFHHCMFLSVYLHDRKTQKQQVSLSMTQCIMFPVLYSAIRGSLRINEEEEKVVLWQKLPLVCEVLSLHIFSSSSSYEGVGCHGLPTHIVTRGSDEVWALALVAIWASYLGLCLPLVVFPSRFPVVTKFSHLSLLMACACLGHGIMRWDDQSSFPFHFLPGCSTDSFKRLSSFYEIMSILQPHWLGKNRTGRTGVDWTQTSVLVSKHSDISGAAAPSQSIDGSHKLEDKWEVNQFSWKELLLMVSWWVHHGDKKCSTTARHWIQTSVLVSKHCDQPGAAVPSQSIDGCHKDEDKWEIPHLKKKKIVLHII